MTRARNIQVLSGLLLASISLTSLRAEVASTHPVGRVESYETFFPDDGPTVRTNAENWGIELVQHEADPDPTPVPPPPGAEAQATPPPAPGGPPPAEGQYGPEWSPEWSGGQGAYACGPSCGSACGPSCGPDCQSCCGTGCCTGGPIQIQNGWGDVWNQWACGPPSGIVGGVEGTFLVPIDEPTQRVILTNLDTGRQYSGDPHGSLGAGVRTWIGLQKCGWGARFRYWHFGNDNVDPEPPVPVWNQPTNIETFHLEANVLDFELTQRFCVHCWQIDTSFGARYADLERYIQDLGYGQVNGVDLYGLAMGANELNGTGFTASIGGRKQIHPCTPVYFFWNYRGSVLWADSTVSVLTDAAAFTGAPPASANARNHANATVDHSENVFIAEAQLGLEYVICPCRCKGRLAFRGGVEFQHWDTGDLEARSQSFAFLQGGPPPFGGEAFADANATDGDLDLIGFFLGLEWTY